jgi:hypothetical protein
VAADPDCTAEAVALRAALLTDKALPAEGAFIHGVRGDHTLPAQLLTQAALVGALQWHVVAET